MIKWKIFYLILIITAISFISKFSTALTYANVSSIPTTEEIIAYLHTIPLPWYINRDTKPKNIIGDSRIKWSKGWIKQESGNIWSKEITYQGTLGGSEFNFKFTDARKIKFHLETSNKYPIVGLEIWLDGKHFEFAYPDLKIEQTTIELADNEKNPPHEVRGRFYCFTIPTTLCDLRIKSIEIDNSAKLLSLGKSIKKTLAILGDSISGVRGNKNYSFLLSDKINYYLLNASFAESTMSDEGGFFPGLSRIKEEIIPFKPDLLIIFLGTNDLGRQITLESFSRDYEKAVNILQKELPKTNIVLLGLLPRVDYSQEKIATFSAVIKNIASKYNLYYVDTYNWLQEKDLSDGIHPSVDAQTKLSELLYNYLRGNNLLSEKLR